MTDGRYVRVRASLGALVDSDAGPHKSVEIDLRVGDYAFDNSNAADSVRAPVPLSVDDDYDAIRHDLWLAADRQYKRAVETLERKRAVAKAEAKSADEVVSFSKEPPSHIVDDHPIPALDQPAIEALAKKLSAVFRTNPDVHDGTVVITAASGHQYFVSSEGSASMQSGSFIKIDVDCSTVADDGMPIHDSLSAMAERFDQLPSEAELVAQVDKLSRELSALRKAPIVDDYSGPVLFTGVAAGQVVRALLADNVSGTPATKGDRPGVRASADSELVGKVGLRILPAGTTVIDDPTTKRVGTLAVFGDSRFDDEGVASTKVSLVENGMFKRFVMSRTPRKGFEHSNGHAASMAFGSSVAQPGNLILSSTRSVTDSELRRRAMAAAREEGLKYVLVVDRLSLDRSGRATHSRPTVMRRVFSDGHDELVRGGSFGALPVKSLKDLLGIGATPIAYHYIASGRASGSSMSRDAGSGHFVSIVTPALLFRDLDVNKPTTPQRAAPIAPRPKPR